MRRRDLLKAAAAGAAAIAAPQIGRAERANKLVFVPTEDLSVLDPILAGPRSRRTHSYLAFDTLYGIDTKWMAQPQMVEGHQVDQDAARLEPSIARRSVLSRQRAGAGARRCGQHSPFC